MYKLKSIARRSSLLGITAAFTATAILPAALAGASSLTPLTERSLLLSSSAPGYTDTDGSGYSTAAPNPAAGGSTPATYAPAGSGPNGMKTGQTFDFRLSSATDIRGFSFQYCTSAAGNCQAPGDNRGDSRDGEAPAAYTGVGPYEDGRETNAQAHPNLRSDLDFVGAFTQAGAAAAPTAGQFQIYVGTTPSNLVATSVTGWTFTSAPLQDSDHTGDLTGKNNYVTLTNAAGLTGLAAGNYVRVVFVPSETVYITNPGSGHFFVKLNTYNSNTVLKGIHNEPDEEEHTVIDGGVTVANVMTDSIHITTKVLETMAFSVGTQNPDTVDRPGAVEHGRCEAMNQIGNNRLSLGNPDAEYSLETSRAWDVYSYWRLSSNSSGGAAVYYSGNTLANTVGDTIEDMQTAQLSNPGTEQFGLGFVDAGLDTFAPAVGEQNDTFQDGWEVRSYPFITLATQTGAPYNALAAQAASEGYDEATGRINVDGVDPIEAKFKFRKESLTVPEVIAEQNETVISCATAKMRYVGNIAADTPAGVYTTKINYLAAPQY